MDASGFTPFVITDKDLEEEFNPSARSRRQTKDQAIYGIWAEDEEEPEKYKRRSKESKYVGFVSAGFNNDRRESKPQFREAKRNQPVDNEFASWEKHTKGIGMKLLKKHGFKPGQGLGQNRQGISTPIVAVATEVDTFRQQESRVEPVERVERVLKWKKGRRDNKSNILTIQELMETRRAKNYKMCAEVIDLTRPVVSSECAKELVLNLDMIVRSFEGRIVENEQSVQREADEIRELEFQLGRFESAREENEWECSDLENVAQVIEELLLREEDGNMPPSFLEDVLKFLISSQPELYVSLDLARLVSSFLAPLFAEEVGTALLDSPRLGVDFVRFWRRYLLNEDISKALDELGNHACLSPYERLLCDSWLQEALSAARGWDVMDCDKMLTFVEVWRPLLPGWIHSHFMEEAVLPRLLGAIKEWSPSAASDWLQRWDDVLGDGSRSLHEAVLERMSHVLSTWHPTDDRAFHMIFPWVGVIAPSLLETFLVRRIVPKLSHLLQNGFIIDPRDQKLDVWFMFVQWSAIIPEEHMVSLLQIYFFPQFMSILTDWLKGTPDYGEIHKWYVGWKSMVPQSYLMVDSIQNKFGDALSLMESAFTANLDGSFNTPSRKSVDQSFQRSRLLDPNSSTASLDSFKDVVAMTAADNGIEFFPIPSKFINGSQVYRFGSAQLYLDHGLLYLFNKGIWRSESLHHIMSHRLYI